MSASLESFHASFLSASIPSGFDPGPAKIACGRCLLLYSTGNATAITTGGLEDLRFCTSAAGSSNSDDFQGSGALWLTNAWANSSTAPAHAVHVRLSFMRSPPGVNTQLVILPAYCRVVPKILWSNLIFARTQRRDDGI